MRRLPWTGRVPGSAGSTAMAPEGGPGSEDPCRAKRPERGVRPRPHDRKARQPPRAGGYQEPGELRTAREAAPERERQLADRRRYEEQQRRKRDANRWRQFREIAQDWRELAAARDFLSTLRSMDGDPSIEIDGRSLDDWL